MKDDLFYLIHMIEHGRKVNQRVATLSRPTFDADENLRLALTHLIQIIGEAATKVSPATRSALPAIPWPQIAGTRHRIVHEYFRTDYNIVWEIATQHVPPLVAVLEPYVRQRLPEQHKGRI